MSADSCVEKKRVRTGQIIHKIMGGYMGIIPKKMPASLM